MTPNLNGAWSPDKVLQTLALKNAMSAMRGKPCPIAARAAWRAEIALAIATLAAD